MFAGRSNELKRLEGLYSSDKFECVVVHGRRRVGKTALLSGFMKDKRVIYFAAQETSVLENMEGFARCISAFLKDAKAERRETLSYEYLFGRVAEAARAKRLLLIIDDYQFLTSSHKGISELIAKQIDTRLADTQLMLVVCGSHSQVMENETLGYDSPFHGKRTAHIKLRPFTFFETKRYYRDYTPYDLAVLYGVTGGVPAYIEMMDPSLALSENIERAFFDTSSPLLDEPGNMLRREVRDPAYYNAVLRAIASGFCKNTDIAEEVGLETSACTAYLKNLIAMGYVNKYTPITEKAGRKTLYEIGDSMLRFWYKFIPENMSMIQGGMTGRIWRSIAQGIPSFMADVFADICRQWLEQQNAAGRLPINFVELGRWWGYDTVWKTEAQISIFAYEDDDNAIFGDCVWSDEPAGADKLVTLMERSRLFRYSNRHYYLFSRSGFSDECAETAARIGASLVMFE